VGHRQTSADSRDLAEVHRADRGSLGDAVGHGGRAGLLEQERKQRGGVQQIEPAYVAVAVYARGGAGGAFADQTADQTVVTPTVSCGPPSARFSQWSNSWAKRGGSSR